MLYLLYAITLLYIYLTIILTYICDYTEHISTYVTTLIYIVHMPLHSSTSMTTAHLDNVLLQVYKLTLPGWLYLCFAFEVLNTTSNRIYLSPIDSMYNLTRKYTVRTT